MKEVKDLFSKQAESYARYRPNYPQELYDFLFSLVKNHNLAWDCGAGNGQSAIKLAEKFRMVYATDISTELLKKAPEKPNVTYKIERAEASSFLDDSMDLITVSMALHWFDFKSFYREVNRVAKNKAIFAAWAYGFCRVNEKIDAVFDQYNKTIVGDYWEFERKYIDERYESIPFPYEEMEAPEFHLEMMWTMEQYMGFLRSWTSTQKYINKNGSDPLLLIEDELNTLWPNNRKLKITFPLFTRIGTVIK